MHTYKTIAEFLADQNEDKKAKPILDDASELITWNSNIRGTLTFTNMGNVSAQQENLATIVKQWLALT